MPTTRHPRISFGWSNNLTWIILLLALLETGCGGGGSGAGSGGGTAPGFSGAIFGGSPQSPIKNSVVTLLAMAYDGYGQSPTQLAQTISSTNGTFSFTGTYSCPVAKPAAQTYIVASGGDAGGGTNLVIGLLALTGPCNQLSASTFVVINELTTAAAEYTLAQFSDADGVNFGTSSTNSTGLDNAVNAAQSNLVVSYRLSGGTGSNVGVPASFLPWSPSSDTCTAAQNCDGLERLDTIANILAACINSDPLSTVCTTLFAITGHSTTTLQAAHVIVTNPASNVNAIYGLQGPPASAPFQPALGSAPADFTLALNFAPVDADFNVPFRVALDSSGNLFVANFSGNSVSELTASSSYATGNNYAPAGAGFSSPLAIALDSSGNVFVSNRDNNSVSELTGSSSYATGNNYAPAGAGFNFPSAIALDSSGNVFVANQNNNSAAELTASSGYATGINFAPASANFSQPLSIALDSSGDLFFANLSGNTVSELTASSSYATGINFAPTMAGFNFPSAIALESSGKVFVANCGSNCGGTGAGSVSEVLVIGGTVTGNNFAPASAGFNEPNALALDSSDNVFVANLGGNSVSELTASSSYATGINYAPAGAGFSGPVAIALDSSGNVFVANQNNDSVSEIIGLAKPVLTPIQACLQIGHELCLP